VTDAVVEARLDMIERAVVRMADGVDKLVRSDGRWEERHQATMERIAELSRKVEKLEAEVDEIKVAMPGLKEMRKYVIMGVVSGALMIGGALLKMVIIDPAQQPRPPVYSEGR
jgi:chromosome segregation ATPase